MATVYLARDVKHDRLVALKVLAPELAATVGHERFLREIAKAVPQKYGNQWAARCEDAPARAS